MNGPLLVRSLAAQRARLLLVAAALALWGFLLPIVYATFGSEIARVVQTGLFKTVADMFSRFAGGDIFTLSGSVGSLGFAHPIPVALMGVFAVGFPLSAVAGERQRGTLEVLLARPIGRRTLVATLLVAMAILVTACVSAIVAGVLVGATVSGVADQLDAGALVGCWANAVVLYLALGAVSLAASASFDRLSPALGISVGLTIAWYAMEFLGALWPDVAWIRPWSLFHYLPAAQDLAGDLSVGDVGVLCLVLAAAVAAALVIFERRDLGAPS